MRWGFRVATDARFGAGHLARSSALAAALHEDIMLFCDPGTKPDARWAKDVVSEQSDHSAAHGVAALRDRSIGALVIDTYAVGDEEMRHTASAGFVAAFRDGEPYGAETVTIDVNPNAVAADRVLAGPGYMPMPPQFAELDRFARDGGAEDATGILVSFGARDSANRTMLALEAVRAMPGEKRILVAIGPHYAHGAQADRLIADIPGARRVDAGGMNEVASVALAIGAPGVSQFERACCGLPTLLLPQNKRQEVLCDAWAGTGAAVTCAPEAAEVRRVAHGLYNDRNMLGAMRQKAVALVDGAGAARLAAALKEKVGH